jgi:hypothetical protein
MSGTPTETASNAVEDEDVALRSVDGVTGGV